MSGGTLQLGLDVLEPAHLVGTGGAIGAVLRYAVGQWLPQERFPFATLTVNVLGSFLLGLVAFAGAGEETLLFVGVGVCGSFTTYSSFSFETVELWAGGDRLRAVLYSTGTLGLCLLAVAIAFGVAGFLGR